MNKFIKLSAISLAGFALTLSAFAQDVSPTRSVKPTRTPIKEEVKHKREEKREVLKERLKTIKDERKKQVVEKIDKSLDALNDRMTKHFLDVLEKLEDILVRISEKADKVESDGFDVSAVDAA